VAAVHIRSYADSGRALPCTRAYAAGTSHSERAYAASARGLCPLDSRWGLKAPDPEMLTHLHFACGRDGGFGAQTIDDTMLTSPPKGGRAGR